MKMKHIKLQIALQGERDDLQVRCSAAMSLNEVTVCENKSLEEKIKEIEEDTNALMNEKKISETKISGLQVSMEEVKSKYDEIYKNFNRMSSENQVLNDIIAAEQVKNDELRQNEQERKKEIELFCSERESQRVHLESMSSRSMALEEQIEGIKARQEDERSIRDEECEKAQKLSIVVLQGAKDELEARCIAAMSENDDLVCESKLLRENVEKMEENNNYLTNEKKVAETKLADLQVSMKVIKPKYEDENNALKKSVAIIQGEKDEVEARLEAARSENEVMVCAEKLKKIEEDNVRLMTEKKIFESKIVDLQSSLDKLSSTCKDENEAHQTTNCVAR